MEQANDVSSFKKILKRYSENNMVFFRGQCAQYDHITSSIARDKGYISNESQIYDESIKMKRDEFADYLSPVQRLAKLQHYGIPTRLIDVTVDPLIALFFASMDSEKDVNNDGYVYVYSQTVHDLESKSVKLLSLLAMVNSYDIENIQKQYQYQYKDEISKGEILSLAKSTAFVKFSKRLQELNPRLYNQKGTFAICGNIVEGEQIIDRLQNLDGIKPLVTVKIPYEYKTLIKSELDNKYAINETFIYPELPSVAEYIKEKYKYTKFSSNGMYVLIENQDISTGAAQRISITIVLKKPLHIEEIKVVVIELIKQNVKNDVVWVFVARNGNDYITKNWILTGQWINESLSEQFRPLPIGEVDDQGYYWKISDDYSVLGDFYEEHYFEDDKELFRKNHRYYQSIRPLFQELKDLFTTQSFNVFKTVVTERSEYIRSVYMSFSNFGHSKDKQLDDFIHNYYELITMLDNIPLFAKRNDLNTRVINHEISNCFQDASKIIELIDSRSEVWKRKLNITSKAK